MAQQATIFQSAQKTYCLDACAVLDFWGSTDVLRHYDVGVAAFRKMWDHIAASVADGKMIVPAAIHERLMKTTQDELKAWLTAIRRSVWAHDDAISELTMIVNRFEVYTRSNADLTDAILVAVAKKHSLTVVTSERYQTTIGTTNPRVPNVCEVFDVPWMNLPRYFKSEGL